MNRRTHRVLRKLTSHDWNATVAEVVIGIILVAVFAYVIKVASVANSANSTLKQQTTQKP